MTGLRVALMLESDGPGGAENVVLHLAESLHERGHQVVHVGPVHGLGWLGAELRQRGIPSRQVSPSGPTDLGCVARLRRVLREEGVNVVHSHEFTMAVFGAAAARLEGMRHIITLHGGTRLTAAWRRRVAVRAAMKLSAVTVAVSEAWRRDLGRALGVSTGRITTVHNGVPRRAGERERTRRSLGIGPEELMVVAVGNLEPWKGHRVLLEATAGLQVPVRVVIAGGRGGSELPALQALIESQGAGGRVQILLERHDVPDLLAAADLFAMPSLFEGLPLALLEAMFAGCAIVASDIGGIPEAIQHERQGILVPPGDAGSLREGLQRLVFDPVLRRSLATAARERAEAEFTIARMVERYEQLYRAD